MKAKHTFSQEEIEHALIKALAEKEKLPTGVYKNNVSFRVHKDSITAEVQCTLTDKNPVEGLPTIKTFVGEA